MVFMQAKICKQFKKNTLVTKSFGEKYLAEKVSESFSKFRSIISVKIQKLLCVILVN